MMSPQILNMVVFSPVGIIDTDVNKAGYPSALPLACI